jgi:hypothetical protein
MKSILFCLAIAIAMVFPAMAQDVTTVQGVLLDQDGKPRADGQYTIVLRVYPAPDASRPLHTYDGLVVQQELGAFTVAIPLDPIVGHLHRSPLFLGISVDAAAELAPRIQLAAVPLAAHARVSEQSVSSPPVGSVVAYMGSEESLPDSWLMCDGRAVRSQEYPELYLAIGTAFGDGAGTSDVKDDADFNLPDLRDRILRGTGDNYSVSRAYDNGSFSPNNLGAGPQIKVSYTNMIIRVR